MIRKNNKHSFKLLAVVSLYLVTFASCDNVNKMTNKQDNRQSIFLNLAADAIVGYTQLGDIDKISKEQAISALNNHIDIYANTQVSCLLFNINYQRSCFDSKVMESYWNLTNPDSAITGWPKMHWKIYKKGIDVYDVCITRSRLKGISPWISFRMNDHHYFEDSTKINKLWLDHPEYRNHPKGLFNYANKEVRDFYKAFITEVLEKYDIDGIELDWMRTHTIFKQGEEAQGIELINQFMREIRSVTKQKSIERGHPIKIAARVPSTPGIGKSFGLDGVAWVKEGLVDVLIPTNWYVPTNFDIPVELWKSEIGKGIDYILAPGADFAYTIATDKYLKMMKSNIETMRGFTVSAYDRGADAVYFFNNFDPSYDRKIINQDGTFQIVNDKLMILNETGKNATSLGKPRSHVYTYNNPDIKPSPTNGPVLLKDIENEFDIYTGPKPGKGNFIIRIGLESLKGFENARLDVKINGKNCQQIEDMQRDPAYKYDNTKIWEIVKNVSETSARMMQFKVELSSVKNGYNRIVVVNSQKEEQSMTWLEVYIE